MVRLFRAVRFLIVMLAYCADMVWRGRRRPRHEKMSFIAKRQKAGCVALTKILNITTEVVGDFQRDQPVLIVSNHLGTLDPWILASQFEVAFVAKSEMGKWPVIGWVTQAVGIIFAHRQQIMKTSATVDEIRERMRAGVAVMIFPEGTTSDGSEILPFKTGGFEAVADMQDGYIVPMYFHVRTIRGEKVDLEQRKKVTWFSPQGMYANLWQVLSLGPLHYVIRVGDPIPAQGRNRKELAMESKEAVKQLKEQEEEALGLLNLNQLKRIA